MADGREEMRAADGLPLKSTQAKGSARSSSSGGDHRLPLTTRSPSHSQGYDCLSLSLTRPSESTPAASSPPVGERCIAHPQPHNTTRTADIHLLQHTHTPTQHPTHVHHTGTRNSHSSTHSHTASQSTSLPSFLPLSSYLHPQPLPSLRPCPCTHPTASFAHRLRLPAKHPTSTTPPSSSSSHLEAHTSPSPIFVQSHSSSTLPPPLPFLCCHVPRACGSHQRGCRAVRRVPAVAAGSSLRGGAPGGRGRRGAPQGEGAGARGGHRG